MVKEAAGPDPRWSSVSPVVPGSGRLRPLGLNEVEITGGFWFERQGVNSSATLAHCQEWMERLSWVGNFRAAVEGRMPEARRGMQFSDSDVYKLMEAMTWEVGRSGSADADQRFEGLVQVIAPAQEADGYLNTCFGRSGQGARYSDLEWGHELYNYGHLFQAAVARARTHGHDEFVDIALRAADH
ncbi:MAG TPA: beta-L-arabinofuranosidase domain-containing protein, partial [Acidimicrobiia bacterium]|nr:beta-L-arabinofuranosidase domain-containing protein [Acidimicrobiia bacterium]